MFDFFFNDCIPYTYNKLSLKQCLEQTLTEYNDIKKSYPTEVDGIITSTSIVNFILNQEKFSLADCIASMSNKDLRTFAYRIFFKVPY